MRIGLDIDGVVADWESNARRLLKEEFGVDLPISTGWSSIFDSVPKEQWDWLWSESGGLHSLFLDCEPYPLAAYGVKLLREIGDVIIVTSVPRVSIEDRLDWLAYHRIFFDEFRVVDSMSEKSKVVPLCDVYIDDSPVVVEDILNHTNARMILWDRPWNRHVISANRGYYRVDNWDDAIRFVRNGNHV